MARVGTRARRRQLLHLAGGALLLGICAAIAGAVVYFNTSAPPPLDPKTLCPKSGARGHLVLLVDKTDALNFTQRRAFDALMREIIERRVAEGELVSVFSLDADFKQTADPLIELCNPGDGHDKSAWTANPKKLHQQYVRRFQEPLQNLTVELVAQKPAKASPIFEMLQMVSINGFRKHDVGGKRRLLVVSDMLHNTPQFTMFSGAMDHQAFSKTDYALKTRPQLQGVEVELHYLMHSPDLQKMRNVNFWEEYFHKAGGRVVAVTPLEG